MFFVCWPGAHVQVILNDQYFLYLPVPFFDECLLMPGQDNDNNNKKKEINTEWEWKNQPMPVVDLVGKKIKATKTNDNPMTDAIKNGHCQSGMLIEYWPQYFPLDLDLFCYGDFS